MEVSLITRLWFLNKSRSGMSLAGMQPQQATQPLSSHRASFPGSHAQEPGNKASLNYPYKHTIVPSHISYTTGH